MAWCGAPVRCDPVAVKKKSHENLPLTMWMPVPGRDQKAAMEGLTPSSDSTHAPWSSTESMASIGGHPLVRWFQEEVVNRIEKLDSRLEDLTSRMAVQRGANAKLKCPEGDAADACVDDGRSFLTCGGKLPQRVQSSNIAESDDIRAVVAADHVGEFVIQSSSLTVESDPESPTDHPKKDWFSDSSSKREDDEVRRPRRPSSFVAAHTPSLSKSMADAVNRFLDDAESGTLAYKYSVFMPFFCLLSAFFTILQSASKPLLCGIHAAIVETTFDALFSMELLARFAASPAKRFFFIDLHNVIDLVGFVPFVLRIATLYQRPCDGLDDGMVALILVSIVPVIRILKCVRRFEKFELIIKAFVQVSEALPICVYSLLLLTMTFSTLIYLVEPRDNISTLPDAMWLTIVTATTVGYGDITPTTTAGSTIVSMLVVCSVLYLSMPFGICGQSFTDAWQGRDRILLMRKTIDQLKKWGYTAKDIPKLFDMFDTDGNRELDIEEFRQMFDHIGLGMSQRRVEALFDSIDKDVGGTISDKEFVRHVFGAQTYHDLYLKQKGSQRLTKQMSQTLARVTKQVSRTRSNNSL